MELGEFPDDPSHRIQAKVNTISTTKSSRTPLESSPKTPTQITNTPQTATQTARTAGLMIEMQISYLKIDD
jgi:hypothetical protein